MKTTMKYILFFFIFYLFQSINHVFSQNNAHLPTMYSWDATVNYPIGWTNYGLGSYTTGNINPNSGKFDNTNDSLVIKYDSIAEVITYYLKGNSLESPCIFDVLESPDGVIYTKLASHQLIDTDTSFQITTKYQQFVFYPLHTSRVIKFVYTQKTAGNIAIDDILIDNSFVQTYSIEKKESQLEIFPNPATNLIYIRNNTEIKEYHIYNMKGQLIKKITIAPYDLNEINISDYPNGKYFVDYSSNKKTYSHYFIKL